MKTYLTHRSLLPAFRTWLDICPSFWLGRHLSTWLLGLVLCIGPTLRAAVIPGLFNTGVDDAHLPLGYLSVDPHYTLTGSPINGQPIAVTSPGSAPIPPWLANNSSSTWITPTTNTVGPGATDGSAVYRYETQFDLTGLDPATAVITGQWSTDNSGIDILLNGVSTSQANPSQFGAWTSFGMNRGFVHGRNTLTFILSNGEGEVIPDGPTGLRVEMTGTAAFAPPILTLFNTGVDAAGTPQADDSPELHYALGGGSAMTGIPFVATSAGGFPIGPWLNDNTVSAWITPSLTTEGPNAVNGAANYFYQTRFDLTGRDPATAVIEGQWSSDNDGIDILINGSSTAQSNPAQYWAWTPFRIAQGFVPGINTLTFVVNNGAGETTVSAPTGLRVEMRGTALSSCVDFQTYLPTSVMNPWIHRGMRFSLTSPFATPGIRRDGAFTGLNCGGQLELDLPGPCSVVELTLVHFSAPALVSAYDVTGKLVATTAMTAPPNTAEIIQLVGPGIMRVVIVAPNYEALLLGVCSRPGRGRPVDRQDLALEQLRAESTEPVQTHLEAGIPRLVRGRFPVPAGTPADPWCAPWTSSAAIANSINWRIQAPSFTSTALSPTRWGNTCFSGNARTKRCLRRRTGRPLGCGGRAGCERQLSHGITTRGAANPGRAGRGRHRPGAGGLPSRAPGWGTAVDLFQCSSFRHCTRGCRNSFGVAGDRSACGEGDWFYFIDAHSGAVLFRLNLRPTHSPNKDISIRTANNTAGFGCLYFGATDWFNQNGVLPE